jgi:hypothetical protein
MRIGILTFHRAHNYGAILQCYALQEVLKNMGHEVEVIDYRQPVIEKEYNKWSFVTLIKKIIKIWLLEDYIKLLIDESKRRKMFCQFRKSYLNIKHKCDSNHIPIGYDVYVIGSDQLLALDITNGIDPVYSGRFYMKSEGKRIGYAISTNLRSIERIGSKGWEEIYSHFSALSVRENTLSKQIYLLSGLNIDVCLDPTLLTTASFWNQIKSKTYKSGKYVVMYEVRKTKENFLMKKAEKIAKANELNVIDLSEGFFSVEDWLLYIKNAECVVTTSFHATVFALIFKRPLYSFVLEDGKDYRYTDLLFKVGAEGVIKTRKDEPTTIPNLDFEAIANRLTHLAESSIEFLKRNI